MSKVKKSAKKTKVVAKAKKSTVKKTTVKKPAGKVKTKAKVKAGVKTKVKTKTKTKIKTKKKAKVSAIPKGYNNVTPYLIVNNGAESISFYKSVFGAKEVLRMDQPNGKVSHAELKIGDSKIMISEECAEMNMRDPHSVGGTPVTIHLYVKDVDAVVSKAITAGAMMKRPVTDMFYGDRSGLVEDPYGHMWCVSTHIEDVSPRETKKRAAAMYGNK